MQTTVAKSTQTPPDNENAVVITHPEHGIFVGAAMGLAFWTLLDTAGQSRVATFSSIAEAREFVSSWELAEFDRARCEYIILPTVSADSDHASLADLIAAGLDHLTGDLLANETTSGALS